MTEQELKKIAGKIAKCLALAGSSNPAEAEAAKRQADALMKKYNLTGSDALASQVSEKICKAGGKFTPPVHLSKLSALIAAYKQQRFGDKLVADNRKTVAPKDGDLLSVLTGYAAAKGVSLHKPVQSKRGHALSHTV